MNTYMPEMGIRSLYTWPWATMRLTGIERRTSEEQPVFLTAEPFYSPEKGFISIENDSILLASRQSIPGQVFQGFVRRQAEEPWVTRPISNVSPRPVLHFLAWVPALTPLKDGVGPESGKTKQTFPSKFWSWCFFTEIETPMKILINTVSLKTLSKCIRFLLSQVWKYFIQASHC